MQDYKRKLQTYLIMMVRDMLRDVLKYGLQGDQHFYIAFSTRHPDVVIPAYLKKKYPDNMTIVLQNDFENLNVFHHHFSVELSFSEGYHKVLVPFGALTYITDPSKDFSLELTPSMEKEEIKECDMQENIIYFPSKIPN